MMMESKARLASRIALLLGLLAFVAVQLHRLGWPLPLAIMIPVLAGAVTFYVGWVVAR